MTTTETVAEHQLRISARDGYELAATHFAPPQDAPASAGTIVINSATATPQTFYAHFARFFASHGYDVYTYDYRGIAKSAPPTLRGFKGSVHYLVEHDVPAVLDCVNAAHPNQPLIYMGHSVGGQLMGWVDNASLIDKAVTFSSQSGYWKLQGGNQKYFVWMSMFVALPVLSRVMGYFPWKRLVGGENIPKDVALQWAKWCRMPNYFFDDPDVPNLDRFQSFSAPILAYCFSDDDWGTRESVLNFMERYTGAVREYRHIDPADYDRPSIGHFGYFRRGSEELWRNTLSWLQTAT